MRFVVVGFSEAVQVVVSWIVEFEGLEPSFNFALRGDFADST